MAEYTPELKRVLRAAGCRFERPGKGDHEIWFSPITACRFPIDAKIKSRHTANAVLQRAAKHRADIVEGRWVIETRHQSKAWEVIVEPDFDAELLVVVTAYPLWDDESQR